METIDKCLEKEFTTAIEIHQFFSKLKFKEGKWAIDIFETKRPANFICKYYGNGTIAPSTYIGNTDENRKINGRVPYRWEIIEIEMKEMKIDNVTVKFCPLIKTKK